jgi:hypothetical protein
MHNKILDIRYLRYKWDKRIIIKRVRNLHNEAKPSCESNKFVGNGWNSIYLLLYRVILKVVQIF